MTDLEKVIKGLEGIYRCISPVNHTCGDCPYQDNHVECIRRALSDAIALLKEQESVIEALKSDLDETLAVLIDRPEIIRCKDCKHWRQLYGDKPFYSSIGCCDCDDMWRSLDGETAEVNDIRTDSDFYCGYADMR